MSGKRETRKAQLRAVSKDGKPGVTLKPITPNVVDDYGSVFLPDAFDASLAKRMPTLVWAHNWSEPLGPALNYTTGEDGPTVDFAFSDFDAVPMARRAHAQVADGTIVDCSVGFWNVERRPPTKDEEARWAGAREVIVAADLDEVSLVLRGAVPGAKVLAVRAGQVTVDAVVEIAKRKAAGELTDEEAKAAIELLAHADADEQEAELPPAVDGKAEADEAALVADVDAALALLDRSRR